MKKLIDINLMLNGYALIHHAAMSNNSEIFQLILNFKGVDPVLKTSNG